MKMVEFYRHNTRRCAMMEAMIVEEKSVQSCAFVERRVQDRRDQEEKDSWQIVCDFWNKYANRRSYGSVKTRKKNTAT
jgi:hypothetical protein